MIIRGFPGGLDTSANTIYSNSTTNNSNNNNSINNNT